MASRPVHPLLVAFLALLLVGTCQARPAPGKAASSSSSEAKGAVVDGITDIYNFGDSISDTGNFLALMEHTVAPPYVRRGHRQRHGAVLRRRVPHDRLPRQRPRAAAAQSVHRQGRRLLLRCQLRRHRRHRPRRGGPREDRCYRAAHQQLPHWSWTLRESCWCANGITGA
uniref:GDSL esterase/lipase n=1 Tax=Oryza glaberrima TaxID=4538 RepID=I1P1Z6_ORYGL